MRKQIFSSKRETLDFLERYMIDSFPRGADDRLLALRYDGIVVRFYDDGHKPENFITLDWERDPNTWELVGCYAILQSDLDRIIRDNH